MVSGSDLYGILLLLTIVPAGWLLRLAWDKREKPGGRWLALLLVGMAGWSVSWALVVLLDDHTWSLASADALLLFVNLSVIGWFMLSLEFTRQKRYALRHVFPLFVVPTVTLLLVLTDASHSLLWGPEMSLDAAAGITLDQGPWFYAHATFNYLLLLVSGVLLVNNHTELEGIYRKQSAILIAGWSIPVVTSIAYNFGAFPQSYLNPTPIGFLAGAALWGWGQYRFQLLEIAPVARRHALDEMDEAVVAVNDDDVVAYLNEAAVEMFDLEPTATGKRLPALLAAYPEILERLEDGDVDDEIVLERDGRRQYLSVKKTPLGRNDGSEGSEGSVVVCEDVSELKRHERDLELLKQVFARVFRHDLSNDLNVIRAHGELLAANIDGPRASHAETIVRTCDDVIETSRKARAIEKLVDVDRDRYETDLVHVVSEAIEWLRANFEDVTVETDLPRDGFVLADGELELAIRCLLENAVVHNDSADPWVRITVTERADEFVLTVEDDGPGIRPNERHVFEDREVDPLSHSNGLGLWTVNWVVRNSGGDAHFEHTDRGTKFELSLERAHPADATPTGPRD